MAYTVDAIPPGRVVERGAAVTGFEVDRSTRVDKTNANIGVGVFSRVHQGRAACRIPLVQKVPTGCGGETETVPTPQHELHEP